MVTLPIPESTGEKLVSFTRGPLAITLWRLFLIVVFLLIALLLVAAGGFFGAALAGLLLSTLIQDDVRAAVRDLWHFRFWRTG